jgi:hypothetical protein
MKERLEAAEEEAKQYKQLLEQAQNERDEAIKAGSYAPGEEEVEVLYDPYEGQNAFAIRGEIEPNDEFPYGQVLSWKSPTMRNARQWRGWIPLEYGDQYTGKDGELLTNYIAEPPPMLAGPARIDNYVRRGDVVLSRLDKRIWDSRQRMRVLKQQERQGLLKDKRIKVLAGGVALTGDGLQESERPAGGFKMRPETMPMPGGAEARRSELPVSGN